MEIWKDIKGYEGLYQVSNLGNVRSLNWRNTGETRNLYLKPHNKGYLQVELANGKRKMFTVHKLVAIHFVPGYEDGFVVNHINENKTDNRAENLEWCTFSHNVRHSQNLHKERTHKGDVRKCAEEIIQMTSDNVIVGKWSSAISIKTKLGYSDWSIKECCKGNRKTAYGYKWQYAI